MSSIPVLVLTAAAVLGIAGAAPVDRSEPAAAVVPPDAHETLTLSQAIAELERRNPHIESAAASIDEAEALVRQSMAALLPIVNASGTYVRNNEEVVIDMGDMTAGIASALEQAVGMPVDIPGPGGRIVIQPLQNLIASGDVQVPLFAAHAYWDLAAARASVEASTASRDALMGQLRGALVRAAWVAAAAEAFLDAAGRAVENAKAHAASTRNLFEAGQATRLATEQADLLVLRREADLAQAQSELAKARLSLGTLLGRGHAVRVELPPDAAPDSRVPELADAVEEALGRRGELRAVRATRNAAEHRVTAAQMRAAPRLVGHFGASTAIVEYPTGLNYGWQAGVTLQWTLYDGGYRYGVRRQALAARRRAAAERRRLEVQVAEEVRNAARELELARVRLALAEQEVRVADAAAGSARRSFAGGHASSLDVLNALDAAFRAQLRQAESRARLAAAAAALRTAQGLM